MLRVALTGGVCSGKSAAAGIFRDLGCFVSQSDEIARAMMQPGEPVYREIVRVFGESVVLPNGLLDRPELARLAFAGGRLEELNDIVHPAVIGRQSEWLQEVAKAHPAAVALVESALIFETRHGAAGSSTGEHAGWRQRFDRIVLLTAPENLRLERYFARVGASSTTERAAAEADVRARMAAQLPDEEKAKLSDFVIQNDNSIADLRNAVERVWFQLQDQAEHTRGEAR